MEELRIGQLAGAGASEIPAGDQPLITVHHMQGSTEGLEINNGETNYLSLHFTTPEKEVLFASSTAGSRYENIGGDSFGDEFDPARENETFGAE